MLQVRAEKADSGEGLAGLDVPNLRWPSPEGSPVCGRQSKAPIRLLDGQPIRLKNGADVAACSF